MATHGALMPLTRKVIQQAEDAGWRVEHSKSGYKFWHPDGVGRVFMHGVPLDKRGRANLRGQFRRMGLEVNL